MEPSPQLIATVEVRPGHRFETQVEDISWGSASLVFSPDKTPVLSIGQAVQLAFRGGALPDVARVQAFVTLRAETDAGRRYRFQLEHGDGTALLATVNRRASFRVTPDPSVPVRVVVRPVEDDSKGVGALLRDISEGGLSFLISKEDEWLLSTWSQLRVGLRLPTDGRSLAFEGDVRYRRLERTAVLYGLRFDPTAARYEPSVASVRRYVALRRREMLERIDRADPDAA